MHINVMTFNIRVPHDPFPNDWTTRREIAYEVVSSRMPDVIGFQEMLDFQRDDMLERVPGYAYWGVGREANGDGEACCVFYKASEWRLDPDQNGTFWYSSTPEIPGSADWGNPHIRICTWGRLIHNNSGKAVWIYNSHWSYMEAYQHPSAELLSARIATRANPSEPYIVTGDLNANDESDAIRYLRAGAPNPSQMTDGLVTWNGGTHGIETFHLFSGTPRLHIDFVFGQTGAYTVRGAEVITDQVEGRYPSDHFPVQVNFTFT